MSNLYHKLQWRALRPNGDNIQPYKIACLAQNETKAHSLFTLLKINDIARIHIFKLIVLDWDSAVFCTTDGSYIFLLTIFHFLFQKDVWYYSWQETSKITICYCLFLHICCYTCRTRQRCTGIKNLEGLKHLLFVPPPSLITALLFFLFSIFRPTAVKIYQLFTYVIMYCNHTKLLNKASLILCTGTP